LEGGWRKDHATLGYLSQDNIGVDLAQSRRDAEKKISIFAFFPRLCASARVKSFLAFSKRERKEMV
jgi:hypothetical protein